MRDHTPSAKNDTLFSERNDEFMVFTEIEKDSFARDEWSAYSLDFT